MESVDKIQKLISEIHEALKNIKGKTIEVHRELINTKYDSVAQYDALDNMQEALKNLEEGELKKLQDVYE